jgi:hypothetical protein
METVFYRLPSAARKGLAAFVDPLQFCQKQLLQRFVHSIQAGEREAFAAGWNAFVARHSSFLISHSIADTRAGLEQAWEKYRKSRKEKIMPVEEPRRKGKRGIEEPDRYPEPKRETKPQIVPPGPPKPPKKAPPGTK